MDGMLFYQQDKVEINISQNKSAGLHFTDFFFLVVGQEKKYVQKAVFIGHWSEAFLTQFLQEVCDFCMSIHLRRPERCWSASVDVQAQLLFTYGHHLAHKQKSSAIFSRVNSNTDIFYLA